MAVVKDKKRPGRPAGDQSQAVRASLLNATRELCISVGLDAASTKTIAAKAGVNPAMINYYFETKEGLSQAMMRDAMAPVLAQLDRLAGDGGANITLEDFMRGYMRALGANPWLPQLVVREVLPINGRFRELFLSELAARAARLLPGVIKQEQAAGRLNGDLDVRLSMLSVASLAVFPFIAAPIVEPTLRVSLSDPAFVERVINHSVEFVTNGLGVGAPR